MSRLTKSMMSVFSTEEAQLRKDLSETLMEFTNNGEAQSDYERFLFTTVACELLRDPGDKDALLSNTTKWCLLSAMADLAVDRWLPRMFYLSCAILSKDNSFESRIFGTIYNSRPDPAEPRKDLSDYFFNENITDMKIAIIYLDREPLTVEERLQGFFKWIEYRNDHERKPTSLAYNAGGRKRVYHIGSSLHV